MTMFYTLTPSAETSSVSLNAALSDVLPVDKVADVEAAREILVGMLKKMNVIGDAGWGAFPVLPSSVTAPKLGTVQDYVTDEVANYVMWPAPEYTSWQAAWNYMVITLDMFGELAKFPLGDPAELRDSIYVESTSFVNESPSAAQAGADLISFLLWLQRTYTNLPKHPRLGTDEPDAGKKLRLGGISPWTIVGLVVAIGVGSALVYARKTDRWPFQSTSSRQEPVLEAAKDWGVMWNFVR